jgi:hypothetical protein
MPFSLHLPLPSRSPDLSRALGRSEPAPAPRTDRFAFWRGGVLGFAGAFVVLDYVLMNGMGQAKVTYMIRYGIWYVGHLTNL